MIGIMQLYRVTSLGIFEMFITGMTIGTIWVMGAVYTYQ